MDLLRGRASLTRFLATGFYSGLSPKAPGTCGTAVAVLCAWLILTSFPLMTRPLNWGLFIIAFTVLAIAISSREVKEINESVSGKAKAEGHDPQVIVIDEMAGYFAALCGVPFSLVNLGLAFVLFRLFDIFKPFPIKRVEKLPRGWGIVGDDILAGVYTNFVLKAFIYLSISGSL